MPGVSGKTGAGLMTFNQRTGDVWITDFDRGVVESLGAVVNEAGDLYILKDVTGVCPPPDYEGIPVYFAFPDEVLDAKILPSFVVRRDDATPAMSRWHLGNQQYRIPAPGSHEVSVTHPITGEVIATGADRYETKDQAVPFDLMYTIQIRARYRNNLKVEAMKMLQYTLKRYPPYTSVYVKDSEDEVRGYTAFMESPSPLDTRPDVAGRETNFNVTLRVEAELDLNDPFVQSAVVGVTTSVSPL